MASALCVGNVMTCGVMIGKPTPIRPVQAKAAGLNGTLLVQQRRRMVVLVNQPKKFTGVRVRASAETAIAPADKVAPAIVLTEKAVSHLKRLKGDKDSLYLRVGVRQGGCSGMSYVMDFEDGSKVRGDDSKIEADGITLNNHLLARGTSKLVSPECILSRVENMQEKAGFMGHNGCKGCPGELSCEIVIFPRTIRICDPKSLLFLFGMQLDYSDALIGGGFSFSNPNATSTCGCGKSFAA